MKNSRKILFFSLFLLLFSTFFYAQEERRHDGNELLTMWKEWEKPGGSSFDSGLFAGMVYAVSAILAWENRIDVPEGVTFGQTHRVVGKYLEDHPERLHENDIILISDALRAAFPKKK